MSFKERLKSISENSKVCSVILAVIVVLQIMVVSYYFIFEKEGYHSDEVWSYGHLCSSQLCQESCRRRREPEEAHD